MTSSFYSYNFGANNEYEDYLSFDSRSRTTTVKNNANVRSNLIVQGLNVFDEITGINSLEVNVNRPRSIYNSNTVVALSNFSHTNIASLSNNIISLSNSTFSNIATLSNFGNALSNYTYNSVASLSNFGNALSNYTYSNVASLSNFVYPSISTLNTFSSNFTVSSNTIDITKTLNVSSYITNVFRSYAQTRTYPPAALTNPTYSNNSNTAVYRTSNNPYGNGTYVFNTRKSLAPQSVALFDENPTTFGQVSDVFLDGAYLGETITFDEFIPFGATTSNVSYTAALLEIQFPFDLNFSKLDLSFQPGSAIPKTYTCFGKYNDKWFRMMTESNAVYQPTQTSDYTTQSYDISAGDYTFNAIRFLVTDVQPTPKGITYLKLTKASVQAREILTNQIVTPIYTRLLPNGGIELNSRSNVTSFINTQGDPISGITIQNTNTLEQQLQTLKALDDSWTQAYGKGDKIRFTNDLWLNSNCIYTRQVTCSGLYFDSGFTSNASLNSDYNIKQALAQESISAGVVKKNLAIDGGVKRYEIIDKDGFIPWSRLKDTPDIGKIKSSISDAKNNGFIGFGLTGFLALGLLGAAGYLYFKSRQPTINVPGNAVDNPLFDAGGQNQQHGQPPTQEVPNNIPPENNIQQPAPPQIDNLIEFDDNQGVLRQNPNNNHRRMNGRDGFENGSGGNQQPARPQGNAPNDDAELINIDLNEPNLNADYRARWGVRQVVGRNWWGFLTRPDVRHFQPRFWGQSVIGPPMLQG